MIVHIVMWRLLSEAAGNNKAVNAQLAKQKLEALNGIIPGLIKLEVGIDFSKSEFSGDLVLYSELESTDALAAYQQQTIPATLQGDTSIRAQARYKEHKPAL